MPRECLLLAARALALLPMTDRVALAEQEPKGRSRPVARVLALLPKPQQATGAVPKWALRLQGCGLRELRAEGGSRGAG